MIDTIHIKIFILFLSLAIFREHIVFRLRRALYRNSDFSIAIFRLDLVEAP